MRLMYQHSKSGPGLVAVKVPQGLPVFVTIDGSFLHRSVEVVINDGREFTAWAGPSGPGNRNMSVEVGRPSAASFLKDFFGFRTGASVSGGGSVHAAPGSVAAGGDITGCAIGRGAVVSSGKNARLAMETGVHLFLPFGCDVESNGDVTTTVGEQAVTLGTINQHPEAS